MQNTETIFSRGVAEYAEKTSFPFRHPRAPRLRVNPSSSKHHRLGDFLAPLASPRSSERGADRNGGRVTPVATLRAIQSANSRVE